MKFSRLLKTSCAILMSILMTNLPAVAAASSQMISTTAFVSELSRAQATQQVEEFLARENVQKTLIERGVSPQEVSLRLATLSDAELRQMAGQMHEAQYGGDILIAILVVVLIIYLVKRI